MSAENKVPAIRFKGFSREWEKYSFSDISESFEYGLNAAATKYDGENKYIRITDISEDTRAFDLGDITSPNADLSKSDNYILQLGDILFARTGASVGKTYIYRKQDGVVYFAGFLIRARVKKEVNTEFVFQSTLTEKYNKFIRLTSQRSGQPGVNALEYGSYKIFLAPSKEQRKIGNYFQQLDTLITQHQKKHDKLLNLKKALLEKMFPKQGATVPEIRLKGFSGEWEVKALGDESEITAGGTPSTANQKYWEPKEIPWMSSGEINKKRLYSTDNMISREGLNSSSAQWIKKNSVLIALAGQGKTRGTVAINTIPLTTNQSIAAITPKASLNYEFLFQNLGKRYDELRAKSSGDGSRGGLNKQIISEIEIVCPDMTEQTKIGNLFKQLDTLLSQHQAQLKKLNNIKRACLEKMFV